MARIRVLIVAVGVVALVGCGGGDEGADVTTTATVPPTDAAPQTTEAGVTTTTAGAPEADIVISDFAFSGIESTSVGSTVTVVNQDAIGHTWTATDLFDSGTLSQGDTFEFTFDEAGEYEYYCVIHPTQMMGTLTVEG